MFALIVTLFVTAVVLFAYSNFHKEEVKGWRSFMIGGWCVAGLGLLALCDMYYWNPGDYGWSGWAMAWSWLILGAVMTPFSLVVIRIIKAEEAGEP